MNATARSFAVGGPCAGIDSAPKNTLPMMAIRVMARTLGAVRGVHHVLRGQAVDLFGHTARVPLSRRSAASTLLLVRLGVERGLTEAQCLAGTGLAVEDWTEEPR